MPLINLYCHMWEGSLSAGGGRVGGGNDTWANPPLCVKNTDGDLAGKSQPVELI